MYTPEGVHAQLLRLAASSEVPSVNLVESMFVIRRLGILPVQVSGKSGWVASSEVLAMNLDESM